MQVTLTDYEPKVLLNLRVCCLGNTESSISENTASSQGTQIPWSERASSHTGWDMVRTAACRIVEFGHHRLLY